VAATAISVARASRATAASPSAARRSAATRAAPGTRPPTTPDKKSPTPVRPPLRVVAAAPRRRLGWVLLAAGVALFVGMLSLTAFQARIAQNQLHLDRLDQELRDARAYYDRLRLAVAQLESPEYVVPRATSDLDMVSADAPLYLAPAAAQVREVLVAAGAETDPLGNGGATERAGWGDVKRLSDPGT
jgi:cell division protein FtsB